MAVDDPSVIPVAYAYLGDKDKAFEILEKQFEQRSPGWVYIEFHLGTTSLRSDPRYSAILKKMGLER